MTLTLRPYQEECIEQLLDRGNLLMAMVMGSGKSITAAAWVKELRDAGEVTAGVIFALNSTKYQWVREIQKVDPQARIQVVDGDRKARWAAIRKSDQYNYTILHYECLVNDWDQIKNNLAIDFVIADEATAIKGFHAKRSKRLKALGRYTPYRAALSGQPIENRPEELFSMMEFVDRSVLGSFYKFDRTFIVRDHWGKPIRYRNLNLLTNRLKEAMFRRSRADIAQWLPTLTEMEWPVELDYSTMRLHDLVRADLLEAIDKALAAGMSGGWDVASHYGKADRYDQASARGQVMSRLLAMRMLSSHPRLLLLSADNFDDPDSAKGSQYASDLKAAGVLDSLPETQPKLDSLIETVDEILSEDPRHKVVVFSYFKPMLRMIGARLRAIKAPYVLLDGDVPAQERDAYIVKFNQDPRCRVFLSSDAGAYGVDLNQGSHLVCYDLPWSAGVLAQRVARIDRTSSAFGQIMVMYFYGQNTIEERMYKMLVQKGQVAKAFIDGDFDPRTNALPLSLESLRNFLVAS